MMPLGAWGNAGFEGCSEWQVVQRRSTIANACPSGTVIASVAPVPAAPGAGRAVKTIAATNAAAPAITARQSERPRAFITYLSATPAMQTRISTSQPSGWP